MTRTPTHISPSQITSARQCVRRWWYEKVHGITSPGTQATHFGSVLHAVVEGYLLQLNEEGLAKHIAETVEDATPAEISKAKTLLASAIPAAVLPKPGSGAVECEMLIPFEPMPGGLKGRLDYVDLDRDTPLVLDHKTTSDPAYAKTEETLLQDPQVILYAYWALLQRPKARSIAVRYVYYLTRGAPRVWAVDISLTSDKVRSSFAWLSEEIQTMIGHFGKDAAEDIPFKMAACNAYGRPCPAMDQCPAHTRHSAKSGLERLRAMKQAVSVSSNTSTGVAQYATVTKESNMPFANAAQVKIALTNFRRNVEAFGLSIDVADKLQEDVLADPALIDAAPTDCAEVVKVIPTANPATPVPRVIQWLINEGRRRVSAASAASAALSAVVETPPGGLFHDVVLSDEQEEYKAELLNLGYPEHLSVQLVLAEAARAEDIIANSIRYTGDAEDDDDDAVAAAPPASAAPPLAGRARVLNPAPAPAAAPNVQPPSGKANEKVVGEIESTGAAANALRASYAALEGDDLATVDAWITGRSIQVGKKETAAFLSAFCDGIDSSSLTRRSKDSDTLREIYSAALNSCKEGARVRDMPKQMEAILLLFGGKAMASGIFDMPFLPDADVPAPKVEAAAKVEAAPAAKAAPATKVEAAAKAAPATKVEVAAKVAPATKVEVAAKAAPAAKGEAAPSPVADGATLLHVLIDISAVRGNVRNGVLLSDLWMAAVLDTADQLGRDPRLDKFGSDLKPVALAVTANLGALLKEGDVTLLVDATSTSWRLCSDEIQAMANLILRANS